MKREGGTYSRFGCFIIISFLLGPLVIIGANLTLFFVGDCTGSKGRLYFFAR
jgi:hypothetical protein